MRDNLLAPGNDFGTKQLKSHLKCNLPSALVADAYANNSRHMETAGAQKADQVYLPVLENAMKTQKLRTTLSVFDRSRFFFNLPTSLVEAVETVCFLLH